MEIVERVLLIALSQYKCEELTTKAFSVNYRNREAMIILEELHSAKSAPMHARM